MNDLPRVIAHLDMDAFFASVEQLDNPELKGKPVIVGGVSDRGVVSAASYEARIFGVRSAMPMATARRLCPHGLFLRGRMMRYQEISEQIMDTLRQYSPLVEQISIDEAYLDLTGTERLFGPVSSTCRGIKQRIRSEQGLTASIGVAPNKFLAKIASDWEKPDGLTIIADEDVQAFLALLPVEKIPGVGGSTLGLLQDIGIKTAGDVVKLPVSFWQRRLGKKGIELYHKSLGRDDSPVNTRRNRKSCGAEETFNRDIQSLDGLKPRLLAQCERVGRDLRRLGLKGKTVSVKIRFNDFQTLNRSYTLKKATQTTRVIFQTACLLLDRTAMVKPVRLTGVSVSNFQQNQQQLNLLPDHESKRQEQLDRVIDRIRDQFGEKGLRRGSNLDQE